MLVVSTRSHTLQMTRVWRGLGPDSGFGFGFFPEFGFGSVSALGVRIRIGFGTRGSDSDRFRCSRFGFGSDRPPQVRIRIGDRFGSDSASEPGAWLTTCASCSKALLSLGMWSPHKLQFKTPIARVNAIHLPSQLGALGQGKQRTLSKFHEQRSHKQWGNHELRCCWRMAKGKRSEDCFMYVLCNRICDRCCIYLLAVSVVLLR